MGKVTIYWDVDGVLNATPGGKVSKPYRDGFAGWNDWRLVNVLGYPILYSAELVASINALAARPDVECRWLTTWNRQASEHLAPALGLESHKWLVIGEKAYDVWHAHETAYDRDVWDMNRPRMPWWKVTALLRDLPKSAPAVWIDDDYRWVKYPERTELSRAGLKVIETNAKAGMKRREFNDLVSYVDAITS